MKINKAEQRWFFDKVEQFRQDHNHLIACYLAGMQYDLIDSEPHDMYVIVDDQMDLEPQTIDLLR